MAILSVGYRVSGLCANGFPGGFAALLGGAAPMIPLEFTLPVAGPITADFDSCLPQQCQEDNDGIQLVVNVVDQNGDPVNLMTASSLEIRLLKPDGTTINKTATVLTSGVDGAVQYTTAAADIAEAGTYEVQAAYVISGKTQTTRRARFRVGENIEE